MTTLQVELLYEEQDVFFAPLPPVLEIVLPDSETFIPVSVEFVTGGVSDNIADDDILNMDLALFYATQKL